jgi:uncharacterized protein (DUF58 family)
MIVPRDKLLLWVAVVVLPCSLAAMIEPSALAASIGAIGLLLAVVLADAANAWAGLGGLSLRLPAVARMSKDRETKLEVCVRNEHQKARTLRLALVLPREIQCSAEDAYVALPAGCEWSRFAWSCRPVQRGNYRLETARIEARSPLGFWDARKTVPALSEIRVYPNLSTERKHLAALFLRRGAFGLHALRQIGKGREFEKLREYIPGDGYDEIHWKATARRGRPITKTYQIERTQEVYVVVDASRLSARPAVESGEAAPPSPSLERFISAALVLALAAEQQGDRFGLLTFSDKVGTFVRAGMGRGHYGACRDALYLLQPQVVTPDYDEVCTFIRLRLRRRALLVFLTALDDPVLAESFVRNVELIRRQHLVLVNMLQPRGVAPLFTDPSPSSVDDLYEQLGGHLRWQSLFELEKVLKRRGVLFSLLRNERLSAELISQYLSIKKRQVL